jgi:hypothetical protein
MILKEGILNVENEINVVNLNLNLNAVIYKRLPN